MIRMQAPALVRPAAGTAVVSALSFRFRMAAGLLLGAAAAAAQQDTQPFDAARVVADTAHRFEELADLDADGWTDALDWYWVDATYDSVKVSGWINDHTGALAPAWTFTLPIVTPFSTVPTDAAIGNLNGDELPDFALSFDARVYLYTGNGTALPSLHAEVVGASSLDSIVLADFDADGLDDLAASDGAVTIWLNHGSGVMTPAGPAWDTLGLDVDDLHVVEADGDGRPDIVDLSGSAANVYVIVGGQLVGQFSVVHPLPTDATNILGNMLAIGDVDGDGDEDGVVFQTATKRYSVLRHGPAGWTAEAAHVGGPATRLADVTGDGIPDGVCCSSGGGGPPTNTGPSAFEIAVNDGTGQFAESFAIAALGSHHIAGAADLDHDGDADLVAGRTIYYARGPLTEPVQPGLDPQDFPFGVAGMTDRSVCDADGDGDPDLDFGASGMVENDGAAGIAITSWTLLPVPGFKKWLGPGHPGDFDGDGDIDLLVTRWQGPFFSPTYLDNYLFRNNGSGVLYQATLANGSGLNLSPGPIAAWDDPRTGLVADLDGDADLDLSLQFGALGGGSRLWLNDGNGAFTYAGDIFTGTVQAVLDLSDDGLPDLVLNTGRIEVRFGLGGGAFSAGLALTATPLDFDDKIAVLDTDGNGTPDLVAAKRDTTSIHVHANDGQGHFTLDDAMLAGAPLETGLTMPRRVVAADVNADGLADLLAWPVDDAFVASWVLIRNANGPGFEPGVPLVLEPTGTADMDGDGDIDVLGHVVQDVEVLYENTTWAGPGAGARLQYGTGEPGTGGVVPKLGASGPFRVNELAALRMTGLPGSAIGLVSVGLQSSAFAETPFHGSTSYNWPWVLFLLLTSPPAQPGVAGSSELVLPYVVPAAAAGIGPLFHQIYFADQGNPYGRVASGGLMLDYD